MNHSGISTRVTRKENKKKEMKIKRKEYHWSFQQLFMETDISWQNAKANE